MGKGRKLLIEKIIIRALIPLLLFIFWIFSSLIFNNRTSFSVLEYGSNNVVLHGKTYGKLYKDDKISGEFIANENNLGMVMIRFNDFVLPDYRGEDILSFKLKTKGSKDWYYINNYRTGLLKRQLLFPFGFPVITDSKGKEYEFELQSLYGNSSNAVELSKNTPVIKTIYQFPRKEIAGSKLRFLKFLPVKVFNSFSDMDFLLSSITYLAPFILYVLLIILFNEKSILGKKLFIFLLTVFILIDILLLREVYSGIFAVLFFIYLISIKTNKIRANTTLSISATLITIWIILVSLGSNNFTLKLNVWVYTFLVTGIFQLFFELKKK